MLTNDLQDNEEIKRQIRSIYCRSNMLIRDFHFCNEDVRKLLYSTFCSNLYCTQLWWCYNNAMFNKVKVAFNNGFRIFLNYNRFCSASNMFLKNSNIFVKLRSKALYNFQMGFVIVKISRNYFSVQLTFLFVCLALKILLRLANGW